MATNVQNSATFVETLDTVHHLRTQNIHCLFESERRRMLAMLKIVLDFAENPWTAEAGASNHHCIDAVALETLFGALGGGNVAIADDGYSHARVFFYLANESPIGLACVHLGACAAMHGECSNSAILQCLGKFNDYLAIVVPAQTGLYGYGNLYRIDHRLCYLQQFGNILQHSRAGTLAGNLLHRAAEINVENIGAGSLDTLGSLDHRLYLVSVYLYGDGALLVTYIQFLHRAIDVAYERVARHKLCIHHVRTEAFAHKAKGSVGNILHGSKKDGVTSKFYISNLHFLLFFFEPALAIGLQQHFKFVYLFAQFAAYVCVGNKHATVGALDKRGCRLNIDSLEHSLFG